MHQDYREAYAPYDLHEAVYHRVHHVARAVEKPAGGVDSSQRDIEQAGQLQRLTAYLYYRRVVNEQPHYPVAQREEYPHDEQRESHGHQHAAVISADNALLKPRADVLPRERGNRRIHRSERLLHELFHAHGRRVRRHDRLAEAVSSPLQEYHGN